jgi:hypothetical protein
MELKQKIKTIILDERKENLKNSLNELKNIRDKSFRSERSFQILINLLNEGYDVNEIDVTSQLKNIDFKSMITDATLSGVKEYIIRYVLNQIFGMNSSISTTAAQFLSDYHVRHLLKPFKNLESCTSRDGMPKIIDGILEVLARYLVTKVTNSDRDDYGLNLKSISLTFGGNMLGEAIRDSDLSEILSEKFCKIIH